MFDFAGEEDILSPNDTVYFGSKASQKQAKDDMQVYRIPNTGFINRIDFEFSNNYFVQLLIHY